MKSFEGTIQDGQVFQGLATPESLIIAMVGVFLFLVRQA